MDAKLSSSRVAEVAARHGLSRAHLYNAIKRRRLKARKVGNATIITGPDEAEWIASMPIVGAPTDETSEDAAA
jgi:hypothetical protein